MADCAWCNEPIGYGSHWISLFKNSLRGKGSRINPITTCPACNRDNVQPPALAVLQLVAMVAAALLLVFLVAPKGGGKHDPVTGGIVLGAVIAVDCVWWFLAARLQQTY